MQFALVDGERRTPFAKGKGLCPQCRAEVIAKCGPRVIHHWAHRGRRNCDPWWENETEWHRAWKNCFPEDWREISHTAADGEVHRADIKTPAGIVVEVQHSAMTDAERLSREQFYGNLVWIIDGRPFRHNFDIYHLLPAPESDLATDIVWVKARRRMEGANRGLFFRLSENLVDDPTLTKATLRGGWYHGIHEIEEQVNEAYSGHHQYDWVRPRHTWLDATCPVFIDFGDAWLVRLMTYDDSLLPCIRLIARKKFIHDVKTEARAVDIGTNFYPLPQDDR